MKEGLYQRIINLIVILLVEHTTAANVGRVLARFLTANLSTSKSSIGKRESERVPSVDTVDT